MQATDKIPSYHHTYQLGDEAHSNDILPSALDAKLLASRLGIDDGAFILRSDGAWRYAVVVDASPSVLVFQVEKDGCTKKVGLCHWQDRVRTLKQSKVLGKGGVRERAGEGFQRAKKVGLKPSSSRQSGENVTINTPAITNILKGRCENIGSEDLDEINAGKIRKNYCKKPSNATLPPEYSKKRSSQGNNAIEVVVDDNDDLSMDEAQEDELIRQVCFQQGGKTVQVPTYSQQRQCQKPRNNKRQSISQVISSVFTRQVSLEDPQDPDDPNETRTSKGRRNKRQSITKTIASIFNTDVLGSTVDSDEGEEKVQVQRPSLLDAQDTTQNGSVFNLYESGNTFASMEVMHGVEDQADEKPASEGHGNLGLPSEIGQRRGKSSGIYKRQSVSQAIAAIFIPAMRNKNYDEESSSSKEEPRGTPKIGENNKKYQEYASYVPPNHTRIEGGEKPTRKRRESFTAAAAASILRGTATSRMRKGNSDYSSASCGKQQSHCQQQRDHQSKLETSKSNSIGGTHSKTPRTTADIFNNMMMDSKRTGRGMTSSPSLRSERNPSIFVESEDSEFSQRAVDQDGPKQFNDDIPNRYESNEPDFHEQQPHQQQQEQPPERKKRTMSALFRTIMTDERKPNSRRRLCQPSLFRDVSADTNTNSSIKRANEKSLSAAKAERQRSSRKDVMRNMDKSLRSSATFRKAVTKLVADAIEGDF